MGKYFGTDGIRGVADMELILEFTLKLGRILGYQLKSLCECPKILIGRDTRISGEMLESALMAGLISSDVDYLTKNLEFELGPMISASHLLI